MKRAILFIGLIFFGLEGYCESFQRIDNFENYDTGASYIEQSAWVPGSSCYPTVTEENGNKFLQSSSYVQAQTVTMPVQIDSKYINSQMTVQFSGSITSGGGGQF